MNTNKDLIETIKKLEKKDDREKIEAMLQEMLNQNPKNIDLLLRLAVLEIKCPFNDEEKSIEYLEKILKIEKDYPIALLMLAYANFLRFGKIDETFMKKLCTLQTESAETNSMLRYVASWFYNMENSEKQELLLKESIGYYQRHVLNYSDLANLYFAKGQSTEAKELIKKALKNVQKIYINFDNITDPTDVNEILDEFFNGINLSKGRYSDIRKKLDQ